MLQYTPNQYNNKKKEKKKYSEVMKSGGNKSGIQI
jgi:hypothetical protein